MAAALILHATVATALLAGWARAPVRVDDRRPESMKVRFMIPRSTAPVRASSSSSSRPDQAALPRLPRTDHLTLDALAPVTVTIGPPSLPYALPGALPGLPQGPEVGIGTTGPVRVSAAQAPGLIKRIEPQYPAVARAARIEGSVVVDAVIRMDGTVSDVTVVRSTNPMFNQPCVDAVRQWRFTAVPQEVVLAVTVSFQLR